MEDLLVALVLWLQELLFEAFLQFLAGVLLDLSDRVLGRELDEAAFKNTLFSTLGYGLLGVSMGWLSLLFFPQHIVRHSYIPGISLLLSPLMTGFMMSFIGSALRRRDKKVTRIESFGYGFAFALGMALIRFFFVK